ncbi:glyceraldehyde-3-phosphate dehydrogenase, partial [Achromobacter xylosoxidans]
MRHALRVLGLWLVCGAAVAQKFTDPEDRGFDISNYLLHNKGLMPVPAVITEPAVGYGGGLMLLYFSESMSEAGERARASGEAAAPPNITGAGGLMTENGSR